MAHTWDDESLAAHNEDDLHRTKLTQSKLPPLMQSKAKLGDEDDTEPANAYRGHDVVSTGKPVQCIFLLRPYNEFGVLNNQGQSEGNGHHGHQHRERKDGATIDSSESKADSAHLQAEGDLDTDEDEECKDRGGD